MKKFSYLLLMLCSVTLSLQARELKGKVYDKDDNPIKKSTK